MSLDYLDLALPNKTLDRQIPRCRICLEDIAEERDDIISPCHCSGTSSLVHVECFNKQNIDHCPICKFKVKFFDRDRLEKLKSLETQIRSILNPIENIENQVENEEDDLVVDNHLYQIPHIHVHDDILRQIRLIPRDDMFTQIEQMLLSFPETIPSRLGVDLPFRQMVSTSIVNARNFIINHDGARAYYFFYNFITDLCQYQNSILFLSRGIVASWFFFLMVIFIMIKTCVVTSYVGLKAIVGRG
jgi:RING-variant domain